MLRAVILAAGEGRRMGMPKALLPWGPMDDTPLAVAHVRALVAAGVDAVTVVLRQTVAGLLSSRWGTLPVTVVVSSMPDAWGPAGSLRAAALETTDRSGTWVLTPVDALPVRPDTLRSLVVACPPGGAAKPVYQDRGGHPVVVDGALLRAFVGPGVPPTLREVLNTVVENVLRVTVDDPGVTADLDTPAAVARWRT